MRIRHMGGEDSNLIFRRKVVLHSGVRLGRVGCSQQGICRGDRAHEDAAGSAVDVDEAFAADGGADEGFGGALYGEIKVGGPADGEVSIDFQFVVFEFDFDQLVLRYVAFEGNGASADEAQIEEAFTAEDSGGNTLAGGQFVFDSAVAGEEYAVLNRHSGGAPFLDIHKNDVFVGRFQHEISVADVLRFYGRFLCHGAFDGLSEQVADPFDSGGRLYMAAHPLHRTGLDNRGVLLVQFNDNLAAAHIHFAHVILLHGSHRRDAGILEIFHDVEIFDGFGEFPVFVFEI